MTRLRASVEMRYHILKGVFWFPLVWLVSLVLHLSTSAQPAMLTGVVSNAISNTPIIGAKVTVNGQSTYTVVGGVYSLTILTPGWYAANFQKTGFDPVSTAPIQFQAGGTVTQDVLLWENPNPTASLSASFDSNPGPHVNLNWPPPSGNYELLYDDGIQDDFMVWATQGNMYAVKFNPVALPATITGGKVNIGTAANYPAGSTPFVPFQISIYNANGQNGTPGSLIGGPVDILPNAFGWIDFTFSQSVVINSGGFYLVMTQGGNAPNACGIAIDQTNPALRSYQRFVTGNGQWIPAGGNFLMRATVNGTGGPLDGSLDPQTLVDYQVWRLRQGEELNPLIWVSVGMNSSPSIIDNSWPSLPCGPYRWAVKAHYSNNRWSTPTFSNIIGKCWTASVTTHIDLSCSGAPLAGTNIWLKNMVYPDTSYYAVPDPTGNYQFPTVWKGTYELKVTRYNYQPYTSYVNISSDTALNVIILQERAAPSNLQVNTVSLNAIWKQPVATKELFVEKWSSGNFTANGWSVQGGYNWVVSQTFGNPPSSAMFGWSPQAVNYNQTLTSKLITGENASLLSLKYDIALDNFGTTTLNQMAVEVWDGNAWKQLRKYDNSKGNISWISESLDINPFTSLSFKFRFRAFGEDTYDINGWYIDNISVVEGESHSNMAECILGYNFYLNNALSGFSTDTTYVIPGDAVQYGQSYVACVEAVYGSGNSTKSCTNFISGYLIPPDSLVAEGVEDAAFLSWKKPQDFNGLGPPSGLLGYYIYRNGTRIDSIFIPDSLSFYDFSLDPGTYIYNVSAKYDLTSYGFAGATGESMKEGPDTVLLDYGRPLPFLETWDQPNFNYNEWTLFPIQGNWIVSTNEGQPSPCAQFLWEPAITNYSRSLQSDVFSAVAIHCASIWLDFDLKLVDRMHLATEKLKIELYFNNKWHELTQFRNNGDLPWSNQHLDLSVVKGKSFRVRFTAEGENSANITSWNIDNIHIYGICNPARNLTGDASGFDVILSWSEPHCGGVGNMLNEGFEEPFFPPTNWTQIVTDSLATWTHAYVTSYWGTHSGDFSAGILSDYIHQNEWLIAQNVEVTGSLQFWSFVHPGSTHQDHYYVKLSTNHGVSWITLLDMSLLPPYPAPGGYNQWVDPYSINLNNYMGEVVDIAWHAVDGDGQGLWYNWAIDDVSIGSKKIHLSPERNVLGYDLFRQDQGVGNFNKVNSSLIVDTTYLDHSLSSGEYRYFVLSQMDECTYTTPSDTITVDVVTNINNLNDETISLFPNPTQGFLSIESSASIKSIRITTLSGVLVQSQDIPLKHKTTLNLSSVANGIYFLKVITDKHVKIKKIILQK